MRGFSVYRTLLFDLPISTLFTVPTRLLCSFYKTYPAQKILWSAFVTIDLHKLDVFFVTKRTKVTFPYPFLDTAGVVSMTTAQESIAVSIQANRTILISGADVGVSISSMPFDLAKCNSHPISLWCPLYLVLLRNLFLVFWVRVIGACYLDNGDNDADGQEQ